MKLQLVLNLQRLNGSKLRGAAPTRGRFHGVMDFQIVRLRMGI
jgi:hypothetical protein